MFRIIVLIILVNNFYHSTASQAEFHVSKVHIRKCRCQLFSNGKIACPYPLLPISHAKKLDLLKCFCNKTNQHKFPEFQAACRSLHPNILINPL